MTGCGPELRASGRNDHAQTADERRTKSRVGRCRREGIPLRVHRAREGRVRRTDAFRDPRAIARMPGTTLEAPWVSRRRKLRVGAVVLDRPSALLGIILVQQA